MKRILTITITLLFLNTGHSQFKKSGGYFGTYNGIELKYAGVPSIRRINNFELNDGETSGQWNRPLRLAYSSFQVNYARIFFRKFEAVIGYEFSNMRSVPDIRVQNASGIGNGVLVQDILSRKNALSFKGRFYRKGSIAPIGKYIGFEFTFANVSVNDDQVIYGGSGINETSESNFFVERNDVLSVGSVEVQDLNRDLGFFTLRGTFGRNFPIMSNFLVCTNVSFPIYSSYKSGITRTHGFRLLDSYLWNNNARITNGIVGDAMVNTMLKYNLVRFHIGIRYQI